MGDLKAVGTSSLKDVRARMKEKKNGPLKTAKLNTSLAAKIKTKIINNSASFKISLKHNNKALALALSAEKETSRRLETAKMFLQKEIEMLHFQNAMLRQNLNIVNKSLQEMHIFINTNLTAAIEISSSTENCPDFLSLTNNQRRSEQSVNSTVSWSDDQEYNFTGMVMRVPRMSVDMKEKDNHSASGKLSELFVKTNSCIDNPSHQHVLESLTCEQNIQEINKTAQIEAAFDARNISNKECLSQMEPSLSNDLIADMPNIELSGKGEQITRSCGGSSDSHNYVTQRKKRSTMSRSSGQSFTVDYSQEECSMTLQSRASKGINEQAHGQTEGSCALSAVCQHDVEFKDSLPNKVQLDHHKHLLPEETVYDAEMDLTASEPGAIVTIASKARTKNSGRKAKADETSKYNKKALRKVKHSSSEKKSRERTKSGFLTEDTYRLKAEFKPEDRRDDESNVQNLAPVDIVTQVDLALQKVGEQKTQHSEYSCGMKDCRRTYVLSITQLVEQEKNDSLEEQPIKDLLVEHPENVDENPGLSNSDSPSDRYTSQNLLCRKNSQISLVTNFQEDMLSRTEKNSKQKEKRKTTKIISKTRKQTDEKECISNSESFKKPEVTAYNSECLNTQENQTEWPCSSESELYIQSGACDPFLDIQEVVEKKPPSLVNNDNLSAKHQRRTYSVHKPALSVEPVLKNDAKLTTESYFVNGPDPILDPVAVVPVLKSGASKPRRGTYFVQTPNLFMEHVLEGDITEQTVNAVSLEPLSKGICAKTKRGTFVHAPNSRVDPIIIDPLLKETVSKFQRTHFFSASDPEMPTVSVDQGLEEGEIANTELKNKSVNVKRLTTMEDKLSRNKNNYTLNKTAEQTECNMKMPKRTSTAKARKTKTLSPVECTDRQSATSVQNYSTQSVTIQNRNKILSDVVVKSEPSDSGYLDSLAENSNSIESSAMSNNGKPFSNLIKSLMESLSVLESPTFEDWNNVESSAMLSLNIAKDQAHNRNQLKKADSKDLIQKVDAPGSLTVSKVLQDMTNTNFDSSNPSNEAWIKLEDDLAQRGRRRRSPVSYKEPKLGSKLRRGDKFTSTEFLSSSIYKEKKKKNKK